jgi:hypothetical protein
MRWSLPLLLSLAMFAPARAEAPPGLRLHYQAYLAGFNVMEIHAGLAIGPRGYSVGLHFSTKGLIGAFLHGESRTLVEGAFQGAGVAPLRFVSAGVWRGQPRRVDITYRDGQPVVRTLVPADDGERDPVPPALQRNSVDTLSAIVLLLHAVVQSGQCTASATTFDGRRATMVSARTVGVELLPGDPHARFRGEATHCRIAGRQIAGFPRDAGADDAVRRPQVADVWFAGVTAGGAAVPVLMSFDTRFFGHMTVYLTEVLPGADLRRYDPGG